METLTEHFKRIAPVKSWINIIQHTVCFERKRKKRRSKIFLGFSNGFSVTNKQGWVRKKEALTRRRDAALEALKQSINVVHGVPWHCVESSFTPVTVTVSLWVVFLFFIFPSESGNFWKQRRRSFSPTSFFFFPFLTFTYWTYFCCNIQFLTNFFNLSNFFLKKKNLLFTKFSTIFTNFNTLIRNLNKFLQNLTTSLRNPTTISQIQRESYTASNKTGWDFDPPVLFSFFCFLTFTYWTYFVVMTKPHEKKHPCKGNWFHSYSIRLPYVELLSPRHI